MNMILLRRKQLCTRSRLVQFSEAALSPLQLGIGGRQEDSSGKKNTRKIKIVMQKY